MVPLTRCIAVKAVSLTGAIDVTYSYDRRGLPVTLLDANRTHTLTYKNDAGADCLGPFGRNAVQNSYAYKFGQPPTSMTMRDGLYWQSAYDSLG